MNFGTATLLIFTAALSAAKGFAPNAGRSAVRSSLEGTASPLMEKETFQRSLLAAQLANTNKKKAGSDAPPVNIGWNSHKPVDKAPDSLVRPGDGPDGNYPMRSKFESMIREAQ